MPKIKVNGVSLNYQERGKGEETILFVHGLLFNLHMFDAQIEALSSEYRCIAFDLRGQGDSEVTRNGYDIENLTMDTLALMDALDCGPCHFVGLSMGGFIGMRLAIDHPHSLRTLSLLDTSADSEPRENVFKYRVMAFIGRTLGFRPLLGQVLPILFGKATFEDPTKSELVEHWIKQISDNDRAGSSRATMAVIKRKGVYDQLGQIKTPTLVIVGDQDIATVPKKSERIHKAIDHSEMLVIADAGHSSAMEQPEKVTQALQKFISHPE
jgi:3-oxoadipate enol-lactonase